MKKLIAAICLFPLLAVAQNQSSERQDLSWADSTYKSMLNVKLDDREDIYITLNKCLEIFNEANDSCKVAHVYSWLSGQDDLRNELDSAMAHLIKAQQYYTLNCDSLIYMSIQVHHSNILISTGDLEKAIEVAENALKLWNNNWPHSLSRSSLYTARAIALAMLGRIAEAVEAFRDVYTLALKENAEDDIINALHNMGAIYGIYSEESGNPNYLDSSLFYFNLALELEKARNSEWGMWPVYGNIARVYRDKGEYSKAMTFLDTMEVYTQRLDSKSGQSDLAILRAECFYGLEMLDSAYFYMRKHATLKDEVLSAEKIKAVTEMQEKYESEKNLRLIQQLEIEKLDSELKKEKVTRTRNISILIGGMILLIALGLWSRLNFTRKAKRAIEKEKERSDELLLNILPYEVAEELKEKGFADAQHIDQVTVLFTDFKGFTELSERLTPTELVSEINECFSAFDHIMQKHGVEKIKTIGDAYMAAGGLPTHNNTHARDVIHAAMNIQQFMLDRAANQAKAGKPYFEIRIGVHTGPVVAGIVGVKKFQYDIWGDTVNTASRMESSGEVGKVNISQSTYKLLKSDPEFKFESRGKIKAKGKGEIEMYFVSTIN